MVEAYPAILAFFGLPGGLEWVVIGVFGLLIFGRRLPDVARSVGKSIVEFKKGLRDAKTEIGLSESGDNRILPDDAKPADANHGSSSSSQ